MPLPRTELHLACFLPSFNNKQAIGWSEQVWNLRLIQQIMLAETNKLKRRDGNADKNSSGIFQT